MSETETKEDYSTNFEDDDLESPFEDNETSLEESDEQNLASQAESGTNVTGEAQALDTSADVEDEYEESESEDEESDEQESGVNSISFEKALELELQQSTTVPANRNPGPEESSAPVSESQSSNVALNSAAEAAEPSAEHKEYVKSQPEPSPSSPFKENSEIEEIMKKIEKLERAQNMLENFLNDEGEVKDNSSVVNSSRSVGSNNVSSYSQPFSPCKSPSRSSSRQSGHESLPKGTSSPSKKVKASQDKENISAAIEHSLSTSLKSNSEIEDIMKQIEKLEMSQNSLETLFVEDGTGKAKPSSVASSVAKSSRSVGSNDIPSRSKPSTPRKSRSSSHQPGPSHPTVAKVLSAYAELKPPVVPVKSTSSSISADRSDKSPRKTTSGRGASGDGFSKAAAAFNEHQKNSKEIEKLKNENLKQEALLEAYQKENKALFIELRQVKERLKNKDEEHSEEVNRLKTEIATLKLNRLVPASPRFGQKAEVDRLNDELKSKADQIIELHREVARLKMEIARPKMTVNNKNEKKEAKPSKAMLMSQEKENEYQKNIRSLQKQVRTLQKILYHKDPTSGPTPGTGSKDELDIAIPDTETQLHLQQTSVLETRILQLESDLTKADLDSKEKLKEFQNRFTNLKTKYEERIRDLELKLREAENSIKPPELSILEDMTLKLEKAQNEITHLKLEISRHKRELEIAAKSNMNSSTSQLTARQDAGTLSLAIKTFKGELAEKEKELLRTRKEIVELKKTNLNLKREREKYLATSTANTHFANRLPVRSKSEIHPGIGGRGGSFEAKGLGSVQGRPSTAGTTTALNRGNAAYQLLQSTLETERSEFEEILNERNKVIRAKEKEIHDLNAKLESMALEGPSSRTKDENPTLVDELRSRLTLSIRVTNLIKDQLNKINAERLELQKEKGVLEFRIRELTQELNLANTLGKPENEILVGLTEKVENLNSRYYYREKQLDAVLNRLAMKTSSSVYPSSLSALGLFHDGPPDPFTISSSRNIKNMRLTELDLASLSPTTMRLLGDGSDSS